MGWLKIFSVKGKTPREGEGAYSYISFFLSNYLLIYLSFFLKNNIFLSLSLSLSIESIKDIYIGNRADMSI